MSASKTAASARPLILGTAGHIDHGKTALVKALTGIDADRLPEEQSRGMTIDLGFARLEIGGRQIGIVDVPGHEKFIRNMVAGATGIDLVMLVIAADDAVMPQTREHLEIIDLLGVPGGLVALNKVDLADDAKISRAEAEIERLTDGTCLEGCPVIRVSAVTGEGIVTLRDAIEARLGAIQFAGWPPLFRLPIDRCFTLQGHGTIVTGSLLGGDVNTSDEVEIMPAGKRARVRNVQSHGDKHEGLASGRRVAVNIAGIKTREIERGFELATPAFLRPSERIAVHVRCLESAPMLLEPGEWLRLFMGTRSFGARFSLIGAGELEPGEEAYAIVQTSEPICATHGQRFIVRSPAHAITFAGGRVVCTRPPKLKLSQPAPEWMRALDTGEPSARIVAMLELEPALGGDALGLYRETGVEPDQAELIMGELADAGRIRKSPGSKGAGFWTDAYIAQCKQEIIGRMKTILERTRPRASVEQGALLKMTSSLGPSEFVHWLINQLVEEGLIASGRNWYKLEGYVVALTPGEEADQLRVIEVYDQAGLKAPARAEAVKASGLSPAKAEPLLAHALDTGRLIELNSEITMHADAHDRLVGAIREHMSGGKGLTVSEIKDFLGVSRKFAIPICEYLDRAGYTKRQGDQRYAGPKLNED